MTTTVQQLRDLLKDLPADMPVEYVELGFSGSFGSGPEPYEFKVHEGKFLIPVNEQEWP